jgi:basic membrane protein A
MTNPEYKNIILTSVLKNYDVSVVQVVRTITEGAFTGGIHVGTLETDEVGLAPFYELKTLISPGLRVELEEITKDIIAGKVKTKP